MKTIKRDSISLAENRQEQYSLDNGAVSIATTWSATVEGPLSTGEHVYMWRDGKTALTKGGEGMAQMHMSDEQMLLLMFSEWLDADKRVMRTEEGDQSTHYDLVVQFLDHSKRSGYTQYEVQQKT